MNATNLAAALLPVVFAVASMGTVGCTAESEISGDGASREATVAVAPIEKLAGSAAAPAPVAPAAAAHVQAAAAPTLRLAVTDKNDVLTSYEVLEFDFGVATTDSLTSSTGLQVSKPTLRPLHVVVRPNAKSAVLGKSLTGALLLSNAVLRRVESDGTTVDLARFEKPVVTDMVTEASDDTRETYELQSAALTAFQGKEGVTIDLVKGTTTWVGTALCGKGLALGPYTQSGPLGTVPTDSTRVDDVSVKLHNVASLPSSGGLSTAKAVLDGITFDRDLETSAFCAMYLAGNGRSVADVRVGIAGPVQPDGTALEATTWDACGVAVHAVGFSGSAGEMVREHVELDGVGLLRTDRNFDPITGVYVKGDTTTGWSFARNAPIASCSEALAL